jgi:hypothetical protein
MMSNYYQDPVSELLSEDVNTTELSNESEEEIFTRLAEEYKFVTMHFQGLKMV